jgi:hypothetical protein
VLLDFVEGAQMQASGTPDVIEIGERPAAQALISTGPISTALFALEVEPGAFSLVLVTLLNEDFDALLPDALRLMETIQVFELVIEDLSVETGTLSQSYSADDGSFSFHYPDDWFLDLGEDEGSGIITLSEGRPLGEAVVPDITALLVYATVPFGTTKLDQFPRQLIEANLALAPGYMDRGERIPFTLNGRPALRVEGEDAQLSGIAVAVLIDDVAYGYLFATGFESDLNHMREQILAIAASLEFSGPEFEAIEAEAGEELSASFVSQNGLTQLRYPPDWQIEEREGLIFVSNMPLAGFGEAEPGQVVLLLATVPYSAFTAIRDEATPLDLLYQIQPALGFSAGIPAYTTFNAATAARANLDSADLEGMLVAFELDEALVLTFAIYANAGDLAEHEATLLSIVASTQE